MHEKFAGVWITDENFAGRKPRDVFHRQLEKVDLPYDEMQNRHVLFRKKFWLEKLPNEATMYVTADDYYKLYVNGKFVGQGPAPGYHNNYNYNVIDLSSYLIKGENTLAFHTYYQGLINRVWQSGDYRHGLLCDLVIDGETLLKSDESFLVQNHSGYTETGKAGYDTQYMERYDSNSPEVGFYLPEFDDSAWKHAKTREYVDYVLKEQKTKMLVFEKISPVLIEKEGNLYKIDFGKTYVGNLSAKAKGKKGEVIKLRFGQELNEDGSVRHKMRCNCDYREEWILSGEMDELIQYDYKAFRYAEAETEGGALFELCLQARHYPFELKAGLRPAYRGNETLEKIWQLCVHSQKYGVQESIQDCMDREKGFYLGDGCYTALAHYVLTGDDSMARKLIDDAFSSSFASKGLLTCMDCSFMQEIAEFPLILVSFVLWHYRLSGDKEYLTKNYERLKGVLEEYSAAYEEEGILQNLDRWCLVEWPAEFRDGYAVDIQEGKVCKEAHVAICAYYLHAVRTMNTIAEVIGERYRDETSLMESFINAFYDGEKKLFVDGREHRHVSLTGNLFPYAFKLFKEEGESAFLSLLDEKGYEKTHLFTFFPLLARFSADGEEQRISDFISHSGTWSRMLQEGATTTYEGWGRDSKWNTSLFHLTFSAVCVFLADIDREKLFAL